MSSDSTGRTLSYPEASSVDESAFPSSYLVVAFDCEHPEAAPIRLSVSEVDEVRIGRGDRREHERRTADGSPILVLQLADPHLSSLHARIVRGKKGATLIDDESKNGTFLNGAKTKRARLEDGDLIEVGSTILLFRDGVDRYPREPADVLSANLGTGLGSLSPALARDSIKLARCAATDLPILITGPSGTGKEIAARWIHDVSGRSGPLVGINCGALPETLIESELFGAKRGAYSGADRDRPGLIRAADGGTLFLDEIGELPLSAQVKLLRVLQEKEVTAVGDTAPVKVDIRIVSATLRDLAAAVEAEAFRADLVARVAGFRVSLPALRDRREDIGWLVATLLAKRGDEPGAVRFERAAARALFNHDWPLNIRQLEQALHSARALCDGDRIALEHLPDEVQPAAKPGRMSRALTLDDDKLEPALREQLVKHHGNVSAVAREMGRARIQIRRWCQRFDLDIDSFRE